MKKPTLWMASAGLWILAGSAAAQNSLPADDLKGLAESDRELIHPGNPLLVVGLDQGDNHFRASTPALVKAETAATQVDSAELRARRLAMYQEGQRFDRPMVEGKRLTTTDPLRELPTFVSERKPLPEQAEPSGPPSWSPGFLVIGLIVGGYFLAARRRLRPQPIMQRQR